MDKLRPIAYRWNSRDYTGYFHRWIISKYSDNGEEYALALVETESGQVMQITAIDSKLKFTDR